MPNSRQRLIDALMTIISERGLDQVSIREVAAAANVSIGTVQYYCRSKDEMLRMTYEYVAGELVRRASAVDSAGSVGESIRLVLLELLPLDEPRSVESRVYLAFAARAAVTPALADVQHNLLAALRSQLTTGFQRAKDGGEAPSDMDPPVAANVTAALIDGLLMHHLTDPGGLPAGAMVAALDSHLGSWLSAPDQDRSAPK